MAEFDPQRDFPVGSPWHGVPPNLDIPQVTIGVEPELDERPAIDEQWGTPGSDAPLIGIEDDLGVEPDTHADINIPDTTDLEVELVAEATLPPERADLVPRLARPDPPVRESQVIFQNRQQYRDVFTTRQAQARQRELPGEQPHTREEDAFINRANDAIITIGDRIGVSMGHRLPARAEHHFFDTGRDAGEAVRHPCGDETAEKTAQSHGMYNSKVGIIVVRDTGGYTNIRTLAHEKAHGVATEYVDMEPHRKPPPLQRWGHRSMIGFDDLAPELLGRDAVLGVTEVSADIAAWEMQLATGTTPVRPCYPVSSILVAGVVAKIADEFDVSRLEVSDTILRGNWSTDRTFVDLTYTTLGSTAARAFLQMQATHDRDYASQVAEALDLTDAADALRAMESKQPDFFDWYRVLYVY